MDPDHPVGVGRAETGSHPGPDVSAVGPVAVGPEPMHQLDHGPSHPSCGPTRLPDRGGEPKAGDRGHHDIEGVPGVTAVADRVDERPDGAAELGERPGPTVEEDQRQRPRFGGEGVDVVEVLAVDGGDVVGEPVQVGFGRPPVEPVTPVLGQPLEIVERDAAYPAGSIGLGRPAGEARRNRRSSISSSGISISNERMVSEWLVEVMYVDPGRDVSVSFHLLAALPFERIG